MKKTANIFGVLAYAVTAIVCILSLIINYGSVSKNLDGFHGYTSGHANIFAAISVILAAFCIWIIICMVKDKQSVLCFIFGVILILLPIVFSIINVSLPGNVDTDTQALMLRTAQGFENTSLVLIVSSVVGFIALLCKRFAK